MCIWLRSQQQCSGNSSAPPDTADKNLIAVRRRRRSVLIMTFCFNWSSSCNLQADKNDGEENNKQPPPPPPPPPLPPTPGVNTRSFPSNIVHLACRLTFPTTAKATFHPRHLFAENVHSAALLAAVHNYDIYRCSDGACSPLFKWCKKDFFFF